MNRMEIHDWQSYDWKSYDLRSYDCHSYTSTFQQDSARSHNAFWRPMCPLTNSLVCLKANLQRKWAAIPQNVLSTACAVHSSPESVTLSARKSWPYLLQIVYSLQIVYTDQSPTPRKIRLVHIMRNFFLGFRCLFLNYLPLSTIVLCRMPANPTSLAVSRRRAC